jgi:hypothetical protein
MKGIEADLARLFHMRDAIEEIEAYIENSDFEAFKSNSIMR